MTSYTKDEEGYVIVSETRAVRVGIIGTAKTLDGMTKELFDKASRAVEKIIHDKMPVHRSGITLVSGGSSWMDHIAVDLFLKGKYERLKLYVPCEWDCIRIQYYDTGEYNWQTNPGGMLNQYHGKFSRRIGSKSLEEIDRVHCSSASECVVEKGFHARNNLIASNCDLLIALSWSKSDEPEDGGTLYTWKRASPVYGKVHIPLGTL